MQPIDDGPSDTQEASGDAADADFETVADLFHAASPSTYPERALVVGYWITAGEGQPEFAAQVVNSKLKDLGCGAKNITDVLSALMKRKSPLVNADGQDRKGQTGPKEIQAHSIGPRRGATYDPGRHRVRRLKPSHTWTLPYARRW